MVRFDSSSECNELGPCLFFFGTFLYPHGEACNEECDTSSYLALKSAPVFLYRSGRRCITTTTWQLHPNVLQWHVDDLLLCALKCAPVGWSSRPPQSGPQTEAPDPPRIPPISSRVSRGGLVSSRVAKEPLATRGSPLRALQTSVLEGCP